MSNQITIDILANTKNLVAGVNETNRSLGTLGQSVGKINTAFAGLAAAFGAKIGFSFFKDVIQGAIEDEKAFKQLKDAFGKDIEEIAKVVNSLSKTWYVDDGEIAKYFVQLKTSLRANFGSLVPQLVEGSLAIAQLTGRPIEEVVGLWTKVLRDGVITRQELLKLGINLTAQQEEDFKKIKGGYEQLKFLLDIITSPEYKRKALDNIDPWTKFNKIIGDVKDSIGEKLLPVLDKLVKIWEGLTPAQQEVIKTFAAWTLAITAAIGVLGAFSVAFLAIVTAFQTLGPILVAVRAGFAALTLAMATNPFTGIAIVIGAVITAIILLIKNWDEVSAAFKRAGAAIAGGISSLREGVGNIIENIKNWLGNLIPSVFNIGRDIIQGIVNGIRSNAMAPIEAVKSIGTNLVNAFKSFFRIGSPSRLFAGYGQNIIQGLSQGIKGAENLAMSSMNTMSARLASPTFNFAGARAGGSPINVTINAGIGTDPYELGRVVSAALDKYQGVNGRR